MAMLYKHITHGAVEGWLRRLELYGGLITVFAVYRSLDRGPALVMPESAMMMDELQRNVDRRVTVTGRLHYATVHDIGWIEMERIEAMPLESELPTIDDVAGILDRDKSHAVM